MCFKICAKNVSETPPGSTFLSCMEVNVNTDNAYVAVDCILCTTVSLFFVFIFLVCFGNCVLTWCRVSMNMCDSSRGDLTGVADRT